MEFDERLRKILFENNLDQTQAAVKVGLTGPSLSRFLNKKNEKAEEFEAIFRICETDDQKFFLATGKHLPQESTHIPDTNTEMLRLIRNLSNQIEELKEEVRKLREEKNCAQVQLPQKIPEHHIKSVSNRRILWIIIKSLSWQHWQFYYFYFCLSFSEK